MKLLQNIAKGINKKKTQKHDFFGIQPSNYFLPVSNGAPRNLLSEGLSLIKPKKQKCCQVSARCAENVFILFVFFSMELEVQGGFSPPAGYAKTYFSKEC